MESAASGIFRLTGESKGYGAAPVISCVELQCLNVQAVPVYNYLTQTSNVALRIHQRGNACYKERT